MVIFLYIRDTRTKRVHLYFTVNESGKTNETRKTREINKLIETTEKSRGNSRN